MFTQRLSNLELLAGEVGGIRRQVEEMAALEEMAYARYSEDDVSNPPTDAQLDTAFGTPAVVGAGFLGLLNDAGAGSNCYLCGSDGGNWWYVALTKAT